MKKTQKQPAQEKKISIRMLMTPKLHRKIKIKAAESGEKIAAFCLSLVEKSLAK